MALLDSQVSTSRQSSGGGGTTGAQIPRWARREPAAQRLERRVSELVLANERLRADLDEYRSLYESSGARTPGGSALRRMPSHARTHASSGSEITLRHTFGSVRW